MQRRILISADDYEIRIAVIENNKLSEYFFERKEEQRIVGNIYKGIVTSITPGIDAAFVDIGLPRNAFLYVYDLLPQVHEYDYLDDDENGYEAEQEAKETEPDLPTLSIRDLLKEGQTILVQLYKEPIGAKGSRVTTNISLPGRYLVLLPNTKHLGVSRRIEDESERERLKKVVSSLLPDNMGAIIRTAGRDVEQEEFSKDLVFLQKEWNRILEQSEKSKAPSLVHQIPVWSFYSSKT